MSDLPSFLRSRWDEAEQRAVAAMTGDRSIWATMQAYGWDDLAVRDSAKGGWFTIEVAEAMHIAANDPVFVLADIAAKRRVLELHQRDYANALCGTCDPFDNDGPHEDPSRVWPCQTLRALAAPYSGHPDWRTEWEA